MRPPPEGPAGRVGRWGGPANTIRGVSLYDVLGARPDATAEELRRAFVALARRYHPDRHVGAAPAVRREAEDKMRQVTEAWSVLGDPQRRRYYDLGLGDPVARGHRGRPAGSGPSAGGGPGGGGPGGGSGATAGQGPRSTGAGSGPRATAGAARGAAGADAGRHWRSYGGPGPGPDTGRSTGEQLLLLSPLLLLFGAGLLGMGGAIIGWPPFYAAALVLLICAAATFFMLPIWAMTRGRSHGSRRGGRGPKRSY